MLDHNSSANTRTQYTFSPYFFQADSILLQALKEDITTEDITTNCIFSSNEVGTVDLICKEDGVLCGMEVFARVFELFYPGMQFQIRKTDGEIIRKGEVICVLSGNVRAILSAERVALNFLQKMSGISTYTYEMVTLLQNSNSKTILLDTRKTTPNLRLFEKYAVTVGGGKNHRYNLSDSILIKDNHISAAGGIKNAVSKALMHASFVKKIEVETESLEMVKEALEAHADIIMLDNMSVEEMKSCVSYIDGRAKTECSGNVTKENIELMAGIGVDYISCGALTHSAPILDFSLKNLRIQ